MTHPARWIPRLSLWRTLLPCLLLAAACDDSPTEPKPLPVVGDLLEFNVQSESTCGDAVMRTGRVVAITDRAIVIADSNNPAGGFSDAEYAAFGNAFDQLVWPVNTRTFGEPSDVDQNGRVLIFFTSAVNNLSGTDETILGFYFGRDLFPRKDVQRPRALQGCAASNEAEMFYMRVPDPSRSGFSKEQVERNTVGTIAHEFQHLINASRRLYVNNASEISEEVWLNEALSHIAEELIFYEATQLGPRQNIDWNRINSSAQNGSAFTRYALPNFGRLVIYLRRPEDASLLGKDELPTRGAGWAFLRYAADRKGGSESQLWYNLVNSRNTGLVNLQNVLTPDPVNWMQDWTVAMYADDAVPGVNADRFSQPSWNFRSVMPAISSTRNFPLRTFVLGGATISMTLKAGGAGFVRFGVAPGGRADVRTTSGGSPLPGSCTTPASLPVGGVVAAGPATAGHICVSGGTTGAEFTLIPFFASETQSATAPLQISATGTVAAVGPPNPSLGAPETAAPRVQAASFEDRLRELEMRELAGRVPGAQRIAASRALSAAAAELGVHMSLIRTR